MANPTISKKTENALTVVPEIKELFKAIYQEQNRPVEKDGEIPKIMVSELVSKMAFYYEKIRNTVDYMEEHLLRKNAIERILKRHIVIEGALTAKAANSDDVANHLLTELIRAGYLPNNQVHEDKITELSRVLHKYLVLRKQVIEKLKGRKAKEKNEIINWILALAASDVEEQLGGSSVNEVIINYMREILNNIIVLPESSHLEEDREIQIYVGIYRNYLKFDRDMLGFILFKYFYPQWSEAGNDEISMIASDIVGLRDNVNAQIDHPLAGQLNRIISRYTVFFTILKDVIEDNPKGVYEKIQTDPLAFPRLVKQMSERHYQTAKKKLWRAAIRSIAYIFITKSILVVLLEIPATQWFGEDINAISLAINVSFPAALLFLIVLFSRMPSEANTDKIKEGVQEVVFEEKKRSEPFRLRPPAKRSRFLQAIFGIIYAVTFFVSFGVVVWMLRAIHFSFISIIIFLFFLALVSFFSIRIRKNAKQLIIMPPKENIFSFFADFFYVPIVSAGKWLSENFSRVNVFVFVLDFIIEAPFKIFVTIAEEWTKYVKERKDEIV